MTGHAEPDWLATWRADLAIRVAEDGRAKITELRPLPARLEFEHIKPAFDWALAQLDGEPAESL